MPLKEKYVVLGEHRRIALIEARERAGITRRALADQLGLARQVVWRIEEGWRDPSFDTMTRWIEALGPYGRLELFTPIDRGRRKPARPGGKPSRAAPQLREA